MSLREYARWRTARGYPCSHTAVQKAVRDRIAAAFDERDGKLDADAADALWDATANPAQQRARAASAAEQKQRGLFGTPGPAAGGGGGGAPAAEGGGLDYRGAATMRELFRAQLLQLQLQREKGELVDVKGVRRETFEIGRRLRDRVLAIEARVAPRMVGVRDEREARAILGPELRLALEELVLFLERMLPRA